EGEDQLERFEAQAGDGVVVAEGGEAAAGVAGAEAVLAERLLFPVAVGDVDGVEAFAGPGRDALVGGGGSGGLVELGDELEVVEAEGAALAGTREVDEGAGDAG